MILFASLFRGLKEQSSSKADKKIYSVYQYQVREACLFPMGFFIDNCIFMISIIEILTGSRKSPHKALRTLDVWMVPCHLIEFGLHFGANKFLKI